MAPPEPVPVGWDKVQQPEVGVLKVDQREQIRRAYFIEGKSIRQIAQEGHHHRRTVRQAQGVEISHATVASRLRELRGRLRLIS
ncbi:MAG TPA: hypothetical protein VFA32_11860 [Dehalococcoidia bacterium]|jgi:hypothetical protein|nr:hypothetical protein [Dehalococcoidia bacterium]